jgi:hypothetical protein
MLEIEIIIPVKKKEPVKFTMKGCRTTLKALNPNPCMIFIMIWDHRFLLLTRSDLSVEEMLSDIFSPLFITYLNGTWHKSFVFKEI